MSSCGLPWCVHVGIPCTSCKEGFIPIMSVPSWPNLTLTNSSQSPTSSHHHTRVGASTCVFGGYEHSIYSRWAWQWYNLSQNRCGLWCEQAGITQTWQIHSEPSPFNMTSEGSNCLLTELIWRNTFHWANSPQRSCTWQVGSISGALNKDDQMKSNGQEQSKSSRNYKSFQGLKIKCKHTGWCMAFYLHFYRVSVGTCLEK